MQSSSLASIDAHPLRPTPAASQGVAARDGASASDPVAAAAPAPGHVSTVSIVVIVKNGRAGLQDCVNRVSAIDVGAAARELVIVDAGAREDARALLADLDARDGVRVVRTPEAAGAAAAAALGIHASTGQLVILQDAGLECDPGDYGRLLAPLTAGKADVVYGSRYLGGLGARQVSHFWPSVGDRVLTLWANAFTGLNLTDVRLGLVVFTREIADRLELTAKGAALDAEIVCKVTRLRARVWEVPIAWIAGQPRGRGAWAWGRAALGILRYWRWEAPVDDVGAITLRRMAGLRPYNQWLHRRFEHYLGNRVLEVGSGVGNQTCYFADRERVVASDVEPHYVRELTATFGRVSNVRVASFRFPLMADARADLRGERIDSIVCSNVLEHIEDDRGTLADFAAVLRPGGHLVLLVPALPALYGTLDVALGHFRRYAKDALTQLVGDAGFEIETIRYLNRPGVIGWWLNSRLLKRRVLPSGQLRAFKWIMPLLRLEERRAPSFGLSLLVLARRRGA
jgi:glycosyltransferase involved in cell wall biosynthesis